MDNGKKHTLNGFGSAFRLITPTLIAILGTLMLTGQNDLKKNLGTLEEHFVNHLMHHQDLEVGYERRITSIEGNRFTSVDGRILEDRIRKELPPKWLIEKVDTVDLKVNALKTFHEKDIEEKIKNHRR